jgi:hypothetical protein
MRQFSAFQKQSSIGSSIILLSMQIEAFDSIILLGPLKRYKIVVKEINVRPE